MVTAGVCGIVGDCGSDRKPGRREGRRGKGKEEEHLDDLEEHLDEELMGFDLFD